MSSVRRAVIDVGTNSIKLLVAEVEGHEVRPLLEESRQTRLGRGFYPDHVLQPGPVSDSAMAIAEFAQKAAALDAGQPQVIATSAARDARNRSDLEEAVARRCGLRVRVITGEEEAEYAFRGVTTDPALAKDPLLLLDVGGGSTEFIVGAGNTTFFGRSFPLGTVRLLEESHPSDTPAPSELSECRERIQRLLEREITPALRPGLERATSQGTKLKFVGTGGTASILGCMEAQLTTFDRERLEATRLKRERVRWHLERLWAMPLAERRTVVGLPPNRADVILTGCAIYDAIMNHFQFEELRVSTRGLRFAVVMDKPA
jgi:exopolyphosphatase / guanosine-5'-triphosphate,3'-diphosphate pyrophosphatase